MAFHFYTNSLVETEYWYYCGKIFIFRTCLYWDWSVFGVGYAIMVEEGESILCYHSENKCLTMLFTYQDSDDK